MSLSLKKKTVHENLISSSCPVVSKKKSFSFVICCSSVGLPVDDTVCLLTGWERLTLCAVESGPARAAPALPIVGTALGSVVTVTRVETIRAPVPRGTGCRRQRHSQAHGHTPSHTYSMSYACMHAYIKHITQMFEEMSKYSPHIEIFLYLTQILAENRV